MQRYCEDLEQDESIRPVDLSTFSADYFGTSDPLYDAMWAAVLRGAVWRVFEPGCQFDFVLTLKGDQGIRKSSSFQALVPDPDWFSSSTHDQSKDMTVGFAPCLDHGACRAGTHHGQAINRGSHKPHHHQDRPLPCALWEVL